MLPQSTTEVVKVMGSIPASGRARGVVGAVVAKAGVANAVGAYGERLAARYLTESGMQILDRNWRCDQGEIDIVAIDDTCLVIVEADLERGLPKIMFSGLPDAACRQAPDRITAAAMNSGVPIPKRRLTVNLSPASIPKVGSGWDLPIAIAALAAAEVLKAHVVDGIVHIGELGLDGSIRPVRGVLPVVLTAARLGMTQIVVPAANAAEAALVPGISVARGHHRDTGD